ncbi:MAG: N-acetylmuramoyl-L-alanine amidase [Oscillospiraceae bacterium]|nr:N-acetylmuramoyl-L-alanine amidase [Oscillospiraceae bacterium]
MTMYKKFRLPLLLTFVAGFLLIVFTSTPDDVLPVSGGGGGSVGMIILDAGHGGADPGCVGINGALEKDINLKIVKALENMLSFSGYDVLLTRSEDISLHDVGISGLRNQKVSDMENRKKIIDDNPDSIFLSIHQNQFTQPQIFGAQMFYVDNNADSARLALALQNNFKELEPDNTREIKLIDNGLFLFKNTTQPAVLIECGFLSNPNDAANLNDREYQKRVAFTIYKSVIQHLSNSRETTQPEETQKTNEIIEVLYMQERE